MQAQFVQQREFVTYSNESMTDDTVTADFQMHFDSQSTLNWIVQLLEIHLNMVPGIEEPELPFKRQSSLMTLPRITLQMPSRTYTHTPP